MAASLYTLAALQQAIYSRGLEDNDIMWTPAELTTIINECIQLLNIHTGFYQGTLTLISNAGQLVYSTPAGMIYPQRCQFEGVQLDPVPITRIGQDYRTWATDTTLSTGGPVARWIPIGLNYFCLHPTDSTGGGSIAITGVLETPPLVNPTDSMVLDDAYATLIVEYGSHRLPLKIGGKTAADALQLFQKGYLPTMKALTQLETMKWTKFFIQNAAPAMEGRTKP